MDHQDTECVCLFCQKTDSLHVINNSSLLIDSSAFRCQDVIFEIFYSKADDAVVNFICKQCKELLKEFYVFKMKAKNSLLPSVFDDLKDFLNSGDGKGEPIYKRMDTRFIVSFEPDEEDLGLEVNIEKIEESNVQFVDEEVTTAVEEESEPYFEVEHIIDDSEEAISEDEDSLRTKDAKMESTDFLKSEKTYQCQCGAESLSLKEYQLHVSQHKRKSIVIAKTTCCDVDFKDMKSYEIHMKAHESYLAIAPYIESFACSSCPVMFINQDDLATHKAQHENGSDPDGIILIEKPGAFDDHILGAIGNKLEEESDEDDEDMFLCGHCGKRLSELNLKVHLLYFHTNIVVCPHDTRVFEGTKQIRLFSDHIRNKHPDLFGKRNLFTCKHCDRNFATNFGKLAHMKTCEAKPFACEKHCNKRFATEWLLKNHMKFVYGENRFSCEICSKRCVSKSDLQIHSRSHTNERPYECPICNKWFKTSANRSSHMDIHEPEKRHKCDECGEKFQTRPILRKHKKKHDKKYLNDCVCKICNRKYISKPHLLRHLKSSHAPPADLTTEKIPAFFLDFVDLQGYKDTDWT